MASPNYTALLRGYPGLAEQIAAINAQGLADASSLTAQRRRAVIDYGDIPQSLSSSLAGNVNADINAETRALAQAANTGGVSTAARLREAFGMANEADTASLAARGLLRSGALGQHGAVNLRDLQRGTYGAEQSLHDQLAQQFQGYLGQQLDLRQRAYGATQNALQGVVGQIGAGLVGSGASLGGGTAAPSAGQNYRSASSGIASASAPNPRPPAAPTASSSLARAMRYG